MNSSNIIYVWYTIFKEYHSKDFEKTFEILQNILKYVCYEGESISEKIFQ